jgi:uncharacterized protein YutE (UPF0331/DUF86 family)/predicted nucleotidyltransferase
MSRPPALELLPTLGSQFPALNLFVFHGSRARDDAHERSDWDFAYSGDSGLDELELRNNLVGLLATEDVDLADLSRAGGLLRYRTAKDGVLVFERTAGTFEHFCYDAATFWLDVEPVVRREHDRILAGLGRRRVGPVIPADRVAGVERHLRRVEARLPDRAEDLVAATDASDAVVLHLWLAVQLVIDMATGLCVRLGLGVPDSYRDSFERLARAGHLDPALAERLARAAGFRNAVAHAYEGLDMIRVHAAAKDGPRDLIAFLRVVRDVRIKP